MQEDKIRAPRSSAELLPNVDACIESLEVRDANIRDGVLVSTLQHTRAPYPGLRKLAQLQTTKDVHES